VYSVNIGNGLAGVLSKKENNQYELHTKVTRPSYKRLS